MDGIATEADIQDPVDLNHVVDETFQRFENEKFNFSEINSDSTKAPIYANLRSTYGENLTKEQVSIFYEKLGCLNCALVSDWQIADIRENHTDVEATKILMVQLSTDSSLDTEPLLQMVRHGFVHITNGTEEIYYEPQNGRKFATQKEALEYYKSCWPIPNHHIFALARAY